MRFFTLITLIFFYASHLKAGEPLRAAAFELERLGTLVDGRPSGAMPDIIRLLEKDLDTKIEIALVPYTRMFKMLETGGADFAIFFKSDQSLAIANPVAKFYEERSFLLLRDKPKNPGPKLLIGVQRGVLYDHTFDTTNAFQKILTNSHFHSINLLMVGRVDGIAATETYLALAIRDGQLSMDGLSISQTLNINEAWLQTSKTSRHPLLPALAMSARKFSINGQAKEIILKYHPRLRIDGTNE